jgi:hypothetical protein
MAHRSGSALPADVEGLRRRIDDWRRTRTRRSPMPRQLWEGAVALTRTHGVYPIARALGVNYDSLKRRVVTETSGRGRAEAAAVSFVELRPSVPFDLSRPAAAVVELSNRGGDKLAIHLSAGGDIDVTSLAAAFWIRRP